MTENNVPKVLNNDTKSMEIRKSRNIIKERKVYEVTVLLKRLLICR